MEANGAKNLRHVRSQSSDRFLNVFPLKNKSGAAGGDDFGAGDDELNEDDVFWSGDFSEGRNRKPNSPHASKGKEKRSGFKRVDSFGILAALPDRDENEGDSNSNVLCRKGKPSISPPSSRMIPPTPKPSQKKVLDREMSQSMPILMRKFHHHSLPINVPVMMSKAMEKRGDFADVDGELFNGEKAMLPPHEFIARGSAVEQKTTFSMLEGAGRTLKGRDLRQVRNAVFRRTGFID